MSSIGPGDFLEATADYPAIWGLQALVTGRVYVCSHLEFHCSAPCPVCGDDGVGVVLVGDKPEGDACHCICQLKPIYRPSEGLIRDLLQPIPADLEAA